MSENEEEKSDHQRLFEETAKNLATTPKQSKQERETQREQPTKGWRAEAPLGGLCAKSISAFSKGTSE